MPGPKAGDRFSGGQFVASVKRVRHGRRILRQPPAIDPVFEGRARIDKRLPGPGLVAVRAHGFQQRFDQPYVEGQRFALIALGTVDTITREVEDGGRPEAGNQFCNDIQVPQIGGRDPAREIVFRGNALERGGVAGNEQ